MDVVDEVRARCGGHGISSRAGVGFFLEFFDLAEKFTRVAGRGDRDNAAYAVRIADIKFILGESEFTQGASVLDGDGLV